MIRDQHLCLDELTWTPTGALIADSNGKTARIG
jgi:hypothetical protein